MEGGGWTKGGRGVEEGEKRRESGAWEWDQRIRGTRATMTARVPWTGAGQIQKHHVVRRGFSASSPTADRIQVLSFSDELGRKA
jgi:hypothetical protein